VCGRERRLVARTRDRHAAVHGLLAAGRSQREAAAVLGLSRNTVNRFAAAVTAGELLVKATTRPGKLDPVQAVPAPAAERRNHQRCNPARRVAGQGMDRQRAGGGTLRASVPRDDGRTAPGPGDPGHPPDHPLGCLSRPDTLDAGEQAQMADVQDRCPHLYALAGHVRSFAEMMTRRRGQQDLEAWLATVEADDQPELRSFANGIRRDQQAVTNGLTLPYSSAPVEGNVTRIKMLKRQMYGRASFALLRKRVILQPG